ncbi:hypothetical protein [Streptomyces sp. NPDC046197]|uniref:NACHT domain-containing protein n=1 Tax=Streptomyces sp. NPDC046197 TaxID=3154337 RepID=UPI0033E34BC8
MRSPSRFTTVLGFIITALVLPVATNIAIAVVPDAVKPYLWLAWPAAAISAAVAAALEVRRHRAATASSTSSVDDAARLRRAVEELAQTVHRQWTAEAGIRMLHGPHTLSLRWASTDRPVSAPASAVLGDGVVGGRPLRLRLHGGIEELVTTLIRLPRQRMVLLGDPGAGKTVLAIQLTLRLLEYRRHHGGPVAVLLTLSRWDPHAEHLHTWVARRLVEDYPALANTDVYGPEVAWRLVADGHITPVLDGLDEMPAGLHAAAIDALNRLAPEHPLVITCRNAEYQTAVALGGMALATAAVVELQPVDVPEVIAFLSADSVPGDSRWAPVLTHLAAYSGGPLAQALSSPLMAALARVVYSAPGTDPAELLAHDRFPNRSALEDHLLDAFVPAAYTQDLAPPPVVGRPRPDTSPYSPEPAQRWLAFLAHQLQEQQTRDLAWWRLHEVFSPARKRLVALAFQLVSGLVAGLGMAVGVGLAVGLTAGVAGGLGAGLAITLPAPPGYVNLRVRGRLRLLSQKIAQGLLIGLVTGVGALLTIGLAAQLGADFAGGPTAALTVTLGTGVGVGIGFGAMMWLHTPADAIRSPSPPSVLRDDRLISSIRIVVESFGSGLLAGLLVGEPGFGLATGVSTAAAAGFGGGLAIGLTDRFVDRFRAPAHMASTWGWFLLARSWFALRGELPWRLMGFLDDAHRRGVLRQAGAVYQFRHARLQDRLAAQSRQSTPRARDGRIRQR